MLIFSDAPIHKKVSLQEGDVKKALEPLNRNNVTTAKYCSIVFAIMIQVMIATPSLPMRACSIPLEGLMKCKSLGKAMLHLRRLRFKSNKRS